MKKRHATSSETTHEPLNMVANIDIEDFFLQLSDRIDNCRIDLVTVA